MDLTYLLPKYSKSIWSQEPPPNIDFLVVRMVWGLGATLISPLSRHFIGFSESANGDKWTDRKNNKKKPSVGRPQLVGDYAKGAVYIQIIRCCKTLYAITETHDALMNFWILKNMSGILISLTGIKNKLMLFLHVFCDFMFFLKIFSRHFIWTCFKCLLHMNNHIYKVVLVTCVEESSRWNGRWIFFLQKRTNVFFGFPSNISRFQTSFSKSKSS